VPYREAMKHFTGTRVLPNFFLRSSICLPGVLLWHLCARRCSHLSSRLRFSIVHARQIKRRSSDALFINFTVQQWLAQNSSLASVVQKLSIQRRRSANLIEAPTWHNNGGAARIIYAYKRASLALHISLSLSHTSRYKIQRERELPEERALNFSPH
jgi:hypothetical protein